MAMRLSSPDFKHQQEIPYRFTCEGDNVNPRLTVENVPAAAESLDLIMNDPDAPGSTFTHWVLFNLDPSVGAIVQSAPPGAIRGQNSAGQLGYYGPCPPGGRHRYVFELYALNRRLDLPEGASAQRLRSTAAEWVIETAQLVGLYQKRLA